jgi:hypothetical protein
MSGETDANLRQIPRLAVFSPLPLCRRKATPRRAARCQRSTPAKFERSKPGRNFQLQLRQPRVAHGATHRAKVHVLFGGRHSFPPPSDFPQPTYRTMRPTLRARCDHMFSHAREASFSKKSFGSGATAE